MYNVKLIFPECDYSMYAGKWNDNRKSRSLSYLPWASYLRVLIFQNKATKLKKKKKISVWMDKKLRYKKEIYYFPCYTVVIQSYTVYNFSFSFFNLHRLTTQILFCIFYGLLTDIWYLHNGTSCLISSFFHRKFEFLSISTYWKLYMEKPFDNIFFIYLYVLHIWKRI